MNAARETVRTPHVVYLEQRPEVPEQVHVPAAHFGATSDFVPKGHISPCYVRAKDAPRLAASTRSPVDGRQVSAEIECFPATDHPTITRGERTSQTRVRQLFPQRVHPSRRPSLPVLVRFRSRAFARRGQPPDAAEEVAVSPSSWPAFHQRLAVYLQQPARHERGLSGTSETLVLAGCAR